jgi:subtilisin family serine protease
MLTPSALKSRYSVHFRQDNPRKLENSAPHLSLGFDPEIEGLWQESIGDPRVANAILDGPVDRAHASLRGANLTQFEGMVPSAPDTGPASRHGTHIASILFGQHDSVIKGIAPRCRGFLLPIFESAEEHGFRPCSQLDLARAITDVAMRGVHIINISGGELSHAGRAHPLLEDAIRACIRRNILFVSAAGNDGCACFHIPAALESVLAVGALDSHGQPLSSGNWGGPYQSQGLLAPGERIPGAVPGGGITWGTGSSYAAAVVSGVAALLLTGRLESNLSLACQSMLPSCPCRAVSCVKLGKRASPQVQERRSAVLSIFQEETALLAHEYHCTEALS